MTKPISKVVNLLDVESRGGLQWHRGMVFLQNGDQKSRAKSCLKRLGKNPLSYKRAG